MLFDVGSSLRVYCVCISGVRASSHKIRVAGVSCDGVEWRKETNKSKYGMDGDQWRRWCEEFRSTLALYSCAFYFFFRLCSFCVRYYVCVCRQAAAAMWLNFCPFTMHAMWYMVIIICVCAIRCDIRARDIRLCLEFYIYSYTRQCHGREGRS